MFLKILASLLTEQQRKTSEHFIKSLGDERGVCVLSGVLADEKSAQVPYGRTGNYC
jgi:hypothetical protein